MPYDGRGGVYRHWKGGTYWVVGITIDADTGAPSVLYRSDVGFPVELSRKWDERTDRLVAYIRPLGSFDAWVNSGLLDDDGGPVTVPRFARPDDPVWDRLAAPASTLMQQEGDA